MQYSTHGSPINDVGLMTSPRRNMLPLAQEQVVYYNYPVAGTFETQEEPVEVEQAVESNRSCSLSKCLRWTVFILPCVFFVLTIIFGICVLVFLLQSNTTVLKESTSVLIDLKKNQDALPFKNIELVASPGDCLLGKPIPVFEWKGTKSGCVCKETKNNQASKYYILNTALCPFRSDCGYSLETEGKNLYTFLNKKACGIPYSNISHFQPSQKDCPEKQFRFGDFCIAEDVHPVTDLVVRARRNPNSSNVVVPSANTTNNKTRMLLQERDPSEYKGFSHSAFENKRAHRFTTTEKEKNKVAIGGGLSAYSLNMGPVRKSHLTIIKDEKLDSMPEESVTEFYGMSSGTPASAFAYPIAAQPVVGESIAFKAEENAAEAQAFISKPRTDIDEREISFTVGEEPKSTVQNMKTVPQAAGEFLQTLENADTEVEFTPLKRKSRHIQQIKERRYHRASPIPILSHEDNSLIESSNEGQSTQNNIGGQIEVIPALDQKSSSFLGKTSTTENLADINNVANEENKEVSAEETPLENQLEVDVVGGTESKVPEIIGNSLNSQAEALEVDNTEEPVINSQETSLPEVSTIQEEVENNSSEENLIPLKSYQPVTGSQDSTQTSTQSTSGSSTSNSSSSSSSSSSSTQSTTSSTSSSATQSSTNSTTSSSTSSSNQASTQSSGSSSEPVTQNNSNQASPGAAVLAPTSSQTAVNQTTPSQTAVNQATPSQTAVNQTTPSQTAVNQTTTKPPQADQSSQTTAQSNQPAQPAQNSSQTATQNTSQPASAQNSSAAAQNTSESQPAAVIDPSHSTHPVEDPIHKNAIIEYVNVLKNGSSFVIGLNAITSSRAQPCLNPQRSAVPNYGPHYPLFNKVEDGCGEYGAYPESVYTPLHISQSQDLFYYQNEEFSKNVLRKLSNYDNSLEANNLVNFFAVKRVKLGGNGICSSNGGLYLESIPEKVNSFNFVTLVLASVALGLAILGLIIYIVYILLGKKRKLGKKPILPWVYYVIALITCGVLIALGVFYIKIRFQTGVEDNLNHYNNMVKKGCFKIEGHKLAAKNIVAYFNHLFTRIGPFVLTLFVIALFFILIILDCFIIGKYKRRNICRRPI